MGAVVGEKVTRSVEQALVERLPLVIVSASGGARMQEGTLALMQLAKTCAALERLSAAGVPYISVMSDPTTGGVFASYAVLGDINLAEPNALIGFAGARVAAGTIAQELPPGFQRAEFLFDHGFLDRVVHRRELRSEIAQLLKYLLPSPVAEPEEGRPTFDPIGFLASLAEKVVPDLGPVEDVPIPAGGVAAASGGSGRSGRGGQRPVRAAAASTRRSSAPPTSTDADLEAPRG
jgi:acetyl-CoA carboxylase carboxyltransferase component